MRITDIHSHILYGIDDGSRDKAMSLGMLRSEYEQGVRDVFLTSHSNRVSPNMGLYLERFHILKKAAETAYPGLRLYSGCEVLCGKDYMDILIDDLQNGRLLTLNNTKYVLIEFMPHYTRGMAEVKFCVFFLLDAGYIPVIAHAERYQSIFENPVSDVQKLRDEGCLIQINLYSVAEDYGDRIELSNAFLSNKLVDFVGTDAHRLDYKPPAAKTGADAILERYGDEYTAEVLYGNAEKILIHSGK